ncbi:extensin-2-like [Hevea brasiliensis]|uniref:extensin-2-like n=1 Tax=Hevea brasiliensis TaxID=3981 RepID=UPI0025D4BE8F|nr:extensin-2-like [Hevea brasiliensis]
MNSCYASCKSQQVLRRDYPDSSPWIGIHEETKQKKPLPIYELALEIIRKEGKKLLPLKPVSSPLTSLPLVQPCMMFSPTSYEADFPPLAQQTKISTRPFIHSTKVDSEDLHKPTEAPISYSPFSPFSAQTTPNPFLPTPKPAYSPFGPFNYSYEPPPTYHPSPLFKPTPTPARYEPKNPSSSEESHPPKRKIDKGNDKMYPDPPP